MYVAVMRAPLADHDPSDSACTALLLAFLASPLIGIMILMEFSFFAVDVSIVRSRVAAKVQAALQSFFDSIE